MKPLSIEARFARSAATHHSRRASRGARIRLSPREREALKAWKLLRSRDRDRQPPTHAEVARAMRISESTARGHLRRCVHKGWMRSIGAHMTRGLRLL